MFLGQFDHTIDTKGRMAVPAKFRGHLEKGAIISKGKGRCLSVYTMQRWEEKSAELVAGKTSDTLREIERRIQQGEKQRSEHNLEAPETPIGIPESWEEHVKLMFELQALALQSDMTRVISFMVARELSTLSYPQIGVPDGHHPVSHNNGVPEQVAKKAKVDVLLQNHMLMDPIQERLDKLAARRRGEPHPFIVGAGEYQKFLDVMEGCTQVNIARRKL